MPVMDSKGNLFDERRKTCRRKQEKDIKLDERKGKERRKKDINKK